ncbi:hypothetical protein OUZ56_009588 [Daphnia magna]|uniref:Uncharacterized protein n=1 Tax=Daphnia magna TaxID=35525 RepID=A0ABR0AGG3_9CRUS|nr:hypothetical protein OUZ56_009588 [Daphnia magna]
MAVVNRNLSVPKVSEHFEFSDHFSMGSNDGGRLARLRNKGIKTRLTASRHISAQLSERVVFLRASLWHYTIKD